MAWSEGLSRGARTSIILSAVCSLSIEGANMKSAEAELSPCNSVAPTTRDVVVYVSDMRRSVNWYRDNVGLSEVFILRSIERDSRAVVMEKDSNGVTLVSSKEKQLVLDPQRVCFPQKGAHDPTRGSSPIYLIDPDGTQVELPISQ
jgi:hypothetical protein